MTTLDDSFVARARMRDERIELDNNRSVIFRASNARDGLFRAELEVLDENNSIVGYIVDFGSTEKGAATPREFGFVAPVTFRDVEEAAIHLLR